MGCRASRDECLHDKRRVLSGCLSSLPLTPTLSPSIPAAAECYVRFLAKRSAHVHREQHTQYAERAIGKKDDSAIIRARSLHVHNPGVEIQVEAPLQMVKGLVKQQSRGRGDCVSHNYRSVRHGLPRRRHGGAIHGQTHLV